MSNAKVKNFTLIFKFFKKFIQDTENNLFANDFFSSDKFLTLAKSIPHRDIPR